MQIIVKDKDNVGYYQAADAGAHRQGSCRRDRQRRLTLLTLAVTPARPDFHRPDDTGDHANIYIPKFDNGEFHKSNFRWI